MENIDLYYSRLSKNALKYVISEKLKDKTIPIVELLTTWCFMNDIEYEVMGDAIFQDPYFKEIINIEINGTKNELEDW